MTGHGVAMATRTEKQWNAQNIMAFTMSQTHSVHIHLTSHHYTSHHRHTHTHTHTGLPRRLRHSTNFNGYQNNISTYQTECLRIQKWKGVKTICRRGYRYAEMTQLRTENYQFYTTKFCLGSITLHQNIFLTLMMEWNTTVSSQSERWVSYCNRLCIVIVHCIRAKPWKAPGDRSSSRLHLNRVKKCMCTGHLSCGEIIRVREAHMVVVCGM